MIPKEFDYVAPASIEEALTALRDGGDDAKILADVSKGLGAPMRGIALETIPEQERLAVRGW